MLYDFEAYRKNREKKIRMTKKEEEMKQLKEELVQNVGKILLLLHKNLDIISELGYEILDEETAAEYNENLPEEEKVEICGYTGIPDDTTITKKRLLNNIKKSEMIMKILQVIDDEEIKNKFSKISSSKLSEESNTILSKKK